MSAMHRACIECASCHDRLGVTVLSMTGDARIAGVSAAGTITFAGVESKATARLLCDDCADAEFDTDTAPCDGDDA